MIDLGIDPADTTSWFPHEQDVPYVLIRVSAAHAASWADVLRVPLRRCYVTDGELDENTLRTGRPKSELVAAKLPDTGSVMAGDFGEILTYIYHAAQEHPSAIVGPKKWRLKQDRTKAAPFSDVVHFVMPSWPIATGDDLLLCSESKVKSTSSNKSQIEAAIRDCEKDRTSRLGKTLMWLRERALSEDLGSTTIGHIERFINATDHPPVQTHYRAVTVICSSLVDDELETAPIEVPVDYTVVVISVPDLKEVYESVFDAAHGTVAETEGEA